MLTDTVLFTSLLLTASSATAKQEAAHSRSNPGQGRKGVNDNNGNKNQLGGFEAFGGAGSTPTSGSVGHCTITTTTGKTCSEGIAQSFTLTDVYDNSISYKCSCPTECDMGNAGVGSYTCSVTDDNYIDGFCGDVEIASSIFTSIGCEMDATTGTMSCEENCYCDATKHMCMSEGEECCAGSCQKVTGAEAGVRKFQCMEEVGEEERAKNIVGQGNKGDNVDQYEEAA